MFIKTILTVLIVASITVCGVSLMKINRKMNDLRGDLTRETSAHQRAQSDLSQTKRDLETSTLALKMARTDLEKANSSHAAAVAEIATQKQIIQNLNEAVSEFSVKLLETEALLNGFQAAGLTPADVGLLALKNKSLQGELAVERLANGRFNSELLKYYRGCSVVLPQDLTANVVISDPKWHFVVLDAGEEQGMLERGELFVSRGGKLVAKVVVSRVEKDRSIANILPGWGVAEIMEGDRVVPVYRGS